MRKIKITLDYNDMFALRKAINTWSDPERLFFKRNDTRYLLAALVLIDLSVKLERRLISPVEIKSYSLTPAEALAFHIAYQGGGMADGSYGSNICIRVFQAIDQKRI